MANVYGGGTIWPIHYGTCIYTICTDIMHTNITLTMNKAIFTLPLQPPFLAFSQFLRAQNGGRLLRRPVTKFAKKVQIDCGTPGSILTRGFARARLSQLRH